MTSVKEFITEQIIERTKAASVLAEPLEINGIMIGAGCTETGIVVERGLEVLAEMLGHTLTVTEEPVSYDPKRVHRITSFTVNGTKLYKSNYMTKGEHYGNII